MSPFLHLAAPLWLAGLLLLPALAWFHHRRAGAGALAYSRLPEGAGRSWRLHLPFYLRLAALALLLVALARPQLGYAWEESLTEGVDIQIALDVSGSMQAQDFQPKNRLAVAKEVVKDFIAGRTGDRIGLVVFAGGAVTKAPLTVDRHMLGFLVDSVEAGSDLPRGTAVGVALATSVARLRDSEADSKVVVLVTDGVNNAGAIDPRSAAALADGLDIKVYTIGVGRGGLVPVPVTRRDPFGRERTEIIQREMPMDFELLEEIAERSDGRAFRATDSEALAQIFDEIDRLERTEMKVKRYVRYEETFQPWAWGALALLLLPALPALLGLTIEP